MTRFLARLEKQRLGNFLVRNMALRALICHYVFVFPLSSNSSWTMSPTQHFHHLSPWDKGTQSIFTTFPVPAPNSCEMNLHKIANRYSGTPSETVTATATVHRTLISAESRVEFRIPESQSPLDPGARNHNLPSVSNKTPIISHELLLLPLGEICLQVTVGSGLPVAMHVRLMLFPSLMEISEEISTILGDTVETKQVEGT